MVVLRLLLLPAAAVHAGVSAPHAARGRGGSAGGGAFVLAFHHIVIINIILFLLFLTQEAAAAEEGEAANPHSSGTGCRVRHLWPAGKCRQHHAGLCRAGCVCSDADSAAADWPVPDVCPGGGHAGHPVVSVPRPWPGLHGLLLLLL